MDASYTEYKTVDGKKTITKVEREIPSFYLKCDCGHQSFEFAQDDDEDFGQFVHIEVWEADSRYDEGIFRILKNRIRLAFLILFKGRYKTDYLSIKPEQAEELKNYLSSLEWKNNGE